ncbi:Hypothetical protein, putative [Bodo saltans]|uniref:Uncharacterized protein n=1 Tax=Bodo saltans TaxID=75058 RepID=A0A0S4IUX1_BODSA|nr:Hypothetical protein, putative [Bodo saltans]|eukprot:CUF97417.1 Hypothetical protein, putative [Bodo saltans]
MSESPVRIHGKSQRPRPQSEVGSRSFQSFCRAPIETSFTPRGPAATASMAQCGSAIDHASLRVYTQFGPASEDWRKAVVIHRKPRYPPESAIIKQFRQEQAELYDTHRSTETLPKPPSARYVLPYPNALLTTCGSARDAQSIIRQRKLEATMSASTSARGIMSMEGTLSGYSVRQDETTSPMAHHNDHHPAADQDDPLGSPHVPLPVIGTSPNQQHHNYNGGVSPRRAPHDGSVLSSALITKRIATRCVALLPTPSVAIRTCKPGAKQPKQSPRQRPATTAAHREWYRSSLTSITKDLGGLSLRVSTK